MVVAMCSVYLYSVSNHILQVCMLLCVLGYQCITCVSSLCIYRFNCVYLAYHSTYRSWFHDALIAPTPLIACRVYLQCGSIYTHPNLYAYRLYELAAMHTNVNSAHAFSVCTFACL